MVDDKFEGGQQPDDSYSDDNDAELIPDQFDPGQRQDYEPTQELPEDVDPTQQFSMTPDSSQFLYRDQQYPQQGDFQDGQYPQDPNQYPQEWNQYPQDPNQYPQSGNAWTDQNAAAQWTPQTGQYDGWNDQYAQQGWDQQQDWNTTQNPQGWDQQPDQQAWDGGEPTTNWNNAGFQDEQQLGDAQQFGPGYDDSAAPVGAATDDQPNISEPVGGITFSDEPQPKRKKQHWIIAVAAVLVVALGLGLGYFFMPKNDATKAVPAPASKPAASASKTPHPTVTASSAASASSAPTPSSAVSMSPGVTVSPVPSLIPTVPNNASVTPTPDLVRQLFNSPDAQVQWVALAADGQNAAVAYAPTFNINGKSAGPNGGHLIMRKNKGHWEPLPQGGVIVDDNDCDAMLKVLGDKTAVATSEVMYNKQCDAAIVYDLAKKNPIRLGKLAGVGPLNLDKATSELAATIHVIPDGVSDGCVRNTPQYARYNGFLGGVWTSGGSVQAYLFVGGNNASSNGARIGITEAQLRSDYSKLTLTDVTSDFVGMGYQKALAFSNDGKEVDYLLNGGRVVAYMIRNSGFSPTQC